MDIKDFFLNDRFATTNGIELVDVKIGYAKAQFRVTENHLNAGGLVQGGALFTLADFCSAAAANSYGELCVSIQSSISFFMSAKKGDLITAECTELFKRNHLANYKVDVTNEQGEIMCQFTTTGYCKHTQLPFNKVE